MAEPRDPEDHPQHREPGLAGEPDDAERESAYALLQRGQALLKSRHHAQAAVVLERAARIEPGKGSILEPLGRAFHHSGQYERARETFEALLEVDPSAHWAHFALATTLRKLDRGIEARTHLRLAVALCPSSELYRRALDRVDSSRSKTDAA
jgi:tetratricopeptide (TPR) repeat protein